MYTYIYISTCIYIYIYTYTYTHFTNLTMIRTGNGWANGERIGNGWGTDWERIRQDPQHPMCPRKIKYDPAVEPRLKPGMFGLGLVDS